MKNWKTTVAGIGAILAVLVIDLVLPLVHGLPIDASSLIRDMGVVITGGGLVFAHDAVKTPPSDK